MTNNFYGNYKEESSVPSVDGTISNHDQPTVPVGKKVILMLCLQQILLWPLQVDLLIQKLMLDVLLQREGQLLLGVDDVNAEAEDVGMGVAGVEMVQGYFVSCQPTRSNYSMCELQHMLEPTCETVELKLKT